MLIVGRLSPALAIAAISLTAFAAEGTRVSLYTPEERLLAESAVSADATPVIEQEYVWFGDRPVAQFDAAEGTLRWTFVDHLKTPVLQTAANRTIAWRAEAEPYGRIDVLRAGAEVRQPLRFPGQEQDDGAAGLSYNVNRWYRPASGRYTQADPIGLSASLNLFAYAGQNPETYSDPLGLMEVDSSCYNDGQCGGCGFKSKEAAEQFKTFFSPGWGRGKPKCHQMLVDLARSHRGPGPFGAVTCMEQASNTMVIKCSGDFGAFGGPGLTTMIDPGIIWIQEKGCQNRNLPGFLLDVVFHEALHNCGSPADAGPFRGQMLAYEITDTCLNE
jgi:RHS repeat-associated protein